MSNNRNKNESNCSSINETQNNKLYFMNDEIIDALKSESARNRDKSAEDEQRSNTNTVPFAP